MTLPKIYGSHDIAETYCRNENAEKTRPEKSTKIIFEAVLCNHFRKHVAKPYYRRCLLEGKLSKSHCRAICRKRLPQKLLSKHTYDNIFPKMYSERDIAEYISPKNIGKKTLPKKYCRKDLFKILRRNSFAVKRCQRDFPKPACRQAVTEGTSRKPFCRRRPVEKMSEILLNRNQRSDLLEKHRRSDIAE